ncbi:MerR family transcriptional regulator [Pseudactinotalea sp. Z1739]|uniref:MerR family transcriptional regulator n=1 Tax=Pseudactinotalea sp. Z1739 TaxID=3413028 RepID=UPI003C7DBC08
MSSTSPGPPEDLGDGIRLTVAGVAARLGVAAPTLRTWARRYGLGPSGHVAGSHRRYEASDLARLETMRRLTLEGVAPADAAEIALRGTDVSDGAAKAGEPDAGNGAAPAGEPDAGNGAAPAGEPDARNGAAPAGGPGSAEDTTPAAGPPAQNGRKGHAPDGAGPEDEEPMVADPLTVAAAAVDGDHRRLARLIRRAGREHGLLDGWLMAVRPAIEMVAQRPQPDRPGRDPERLLRAQMLTVLAEATSEPEPDRIQALVQCVPSMSTDAHVLATEMTLRGAHVRVAHQRLEADGGQALLDLVARQQGVLTVILGESEIAENLVRVLCERGDEVFLIALTDTIAPRDGLHRARTLSGALHEIMSLLTQTARS